MVVAVAGPDPAQVVLHEVAAVAESGAMPALDALRVRLGTSAIPVTTSQPNGQDPANGKDSSSTEASTIPAFVTQSLPPSSDARTTATPIAGESPTQKVPEHPRENQEAPIYTVPRQTGYAGKDHAEVAATQIAQQPTPPESPDQPPTLQPSSQVARAFLDHLSKGTLNNVTLQQMSQAAGAHPAQDGGQHTVPSRSRSLPFELSPSPELELAALPTALPSSSSEQAGIEQRTEDVVISTPSNGQPQPTRPPQVQPQPFPRNYAWTGPQAVQPPVLQRAAEATRLQQRAIQSIAPRMDRQTSGGTPPPPRPASQNGVSHSLSRAVQVAARPVGTVATSWAQQNIQAPPAHTARVHSAQARLVSAQKSVVQGHAVQHPSTSATNVTSHPRTPVSATLSLSQPRQSQSTLQTPQPVFAEMFEQAMSVCGAHMQEAWNQWVKFGTTAMATNDALQRSLANTPKPIAALQALQQERDQAIARLHEANQVVASLQEHNGKLSAQHDTMIAERMDLQTKYERTMRSIEVLSLQLRVHEKRERSLLDSVNASQNDATALARAKEQIKVLEEQKANLSSKLEELVKKQVERETATRQDGDDVSATVDPAALQTALKELELLKAERAKEQEEWKVEREAAKERLRINNLKMGQIEKDKAQAVSQGQTILQTAKQDSGAALQSALQWANAKAIEATQKQRLIANQLETEKARATAADAKAVLIQSELGKLRRQLESKEAEIKKLKADMPSPDQLAKDEDNFALLARSVESLKEEKKQLKESSDRMALELEQMGKLKTAAEEAVNDLKKQVSEAQSTRDAVDNANKEALARQESIVASHKREITAKDLLIKQLQTRIDLAQSSQQVQEQANRSGASAGMASSTVTAANAESGGTVVKSTCSTPEAAGPSSTTQGPGLSSASHSPSPSTGAAPLPTPPARPASPVKSNGKGLWSMATSMFKASTPSPAQERPQAQRYPPLASAKTTVAPNSGTPPGLATPLQEDSSKKRNNDEDALPEAKRSRSEAAGAETDPAVELERWARRHLGSLAMSPGPGAVVCKVCYLDKKEFVGDKRGKLEDQPVMPGVTSMLDDSRITSHMMENHQSKIQRLRQRRARQGKD